MRILICSHVFAPSIGGIETVTAVLAQEFVRLGAVVTVVTQTPGNDSSAGYKVVRCPSIPRLSALARKSDIIWQNQISLRTILPLMASLKPIVITHQGIAERSDGSLSWAHRLKRVLFHFCANVAISKAIAECLAAKSTLIGNPFEADEFTVEEETHRDRDIVFLGRLVSDKGCDLALRALAVLKSEGMRATLTVIGDGPEMPALRRMTAELGIAGQVDFRGSLRAGRGRELARHKIMVIPSTWAEPFGIVALEGIAAGCAVVASNTGGLPEAVGPCGLLFPNGDAEAMAGVLRRLLSDRNERDVLLASRAHHLEQFKPETVAKRYLEIFESVLRN